MGVLEALGYVTGQTLEDEVEFWEDGATIFIVVVWMFIEGSEIVADPGKSNCCSEMQLRRCCSRYW